MAAGPNGMPCDEAGSVCSHALGPDSSSGPRVRYLTRVVGASGCRQNIVDDDTAGFGQMGYRYRVSTYCGRSIGPRRQAV